ncbi:4362_t:CDS:2, partial [Entrophospora sp. SA101]
VETCIIKLSYLRKMKTVQVNINRANKDPINYFTTLGLKHLEFPEGTKKEHINVVIKTEKNEIQVTEDTQLMNIISTTSQMPILIFHTIARPFSSYTFQEASKLFNLKVDSMGECPVYHQGIADLVGMDRYINDTVWDLMCLHRAYGDVSGTNEAQYSVFIRAVLVGIIHTYNPADNYLLLEQKVIMGIYGMGPVDFVIKKGNQFIGVTEAKKEAISKGFAQNLIQLHTSYMYPIVQKSSLPPINLSVIGHEFDEKKVKEEVSALFSYLKWSMDLFVEILYMDDSNAKRQKLNL